MSVERFELPVEGLPAAQLCLVQRVPAGDPGRLRAAARRSAAFAWELRRGTDMLLTGAQSGSWRGPAQQALADQLRAHAPELTAAAQRHDSYADALFSYAAVLDETAAQLTAARRQLQQRSDELIGRQQYAFHPGGLAAPASDPGADLLPVARTFKVYYDRWADGLDRCDRALRLTGDSSRRGEPHGLRALGRQLAHAVSEAVSPFEQAVLHPSLDNLSACLGELNVGLSVLGLGLLFICPPAGAACLAAATVLAVAQLAVDSTRRLHGEAVSNTNLGFELAAAIPVGGNAFRALRAADNVVHLVPGGGLMAHEGIEGAHTLAKHVGKSEEFLRHRLATETDISGASSFYNRQVAEEAISDVIQSNRVKVNTWLSGRRHQLKLTAKFPRAIGILMVPGSHIVTEERGLRVILRRTPVLGTGFYVHTAMVTK